MSRAGNFFGVSREFGTSCGASAETLGEGLAALDRPMPLEIFLIFAPACFAINMAFGPNNLLSLTNAARRGVVPAILAAAGRIVSFAVMIAIAGIGLGAVLAASGRAKRSPSCRNRDRIRVSFMVLNAPSRMDKVY